MKWEFNHDLIPDTFNSYLEMNITGIRFTKEDLSKLELRFQTLREVEFLNCKFTDLTFNNIFFVKVKFINCEFLNTNFIECNFNKVMFINNKFTNISIFEATLNEIEFQEGIIQYSKIENSNFTGKFDNIILKENLYRHNKMENIEFFKCEFNEENFINTRFIRCDFRTSNFTDVKINIDELITSRLSNLNMIEILSDKGIIIED